ncbi:hypothetical protein MSWAN_1384 [Methanobacterium paludis]|uniref:Uncharacterized protein n=2 Tax=Methanobacterium paludis (strain DSM 25820 / JCM 18151 / SWAN1) TaxID=868131 RepID=F6D731_METPW|nr:hypothetical protein MSWAN_1384 [Methanobacterium paludis]
MISTVTTTTAAVTTTQAMTFGIIAVLALITLLAIKEILSSETNNKRVQSFVKGSNIAIIPLLLVFVSIVGFKVVSVI